MHERSTTFFQTVKEGGQYLEFYSEAITRKIKEMMLNQRVKLWYSKFLWVLHQPVSPSLSAGSLPLLQWDAATLIHAGTRDMGQDTS